MSKSVFNVGDAQLPARPELLSAVELAWQRLASPGTWWSGAERLAICEQVRVASSCKLCQCRKQALSPYAVDGEHQATHLLSAPAVDATHRLTTDAARCTASWLEQITGDELTEEQYVELVSIVATLTGLDTLDIALGRSLRALPAAQAGEPTRHRPRGAKRNLAWVATLAPEDLTDDDPDPFSVHGSIHIHRAMSLVPQEVINFFDLDVELYLKDHEIRDFSREFREISHAQIELIAGRASAINGCYY